MRKKEMNLDYDERSGVGNKEIATKKRLSLQIALIKDKPKFMDLCVPIYYVFPSNIDVRKQL